MEREVACMLLQDRLKEYPFSATEKVIVDFILDKKMELADYSASAIARETFTSPSLLVRIAKKLGYSGWSELKEAYLQEEAYLASSFQNQDANFPFKPGENYMEIAGSLTSLFQESAKDTFDLLEYGTLNRAVRLMKNAVHIKMFALSDLTYLCELFIFRLHRIGREASICQLNGDLLLEAARLDEKDLAIVVSYSGESPALLETLPFFKQRQVPILALTSVGDNSLSKAANVVLKVSTREKQYSKIGPFASQNSIHLLLEILYACYFSTNYQRNLDYKLYYSRLIETRRQVQNRIIEENSQLTSDEDSVSIKAEGSLEKNKS